MTRRREQPRFLNITHDAVAANDALNQSERKQADARYRRESSLREPAPDVTPAKKPTVKVVRPTTPPAPASSQPALLGSRSGRTPTEAPKPFTALYIRPSLPSKVVPADSVVLSRAEWSAVDKVIESLSKRPEPKRVERRPPTPRRN